MNRRNTAVWISTVVLGIGLSACGESGAGGAPASTGITPKIMADSLHAVLEADRTVYTRNVVNRLQNQEKIIRASEHWNDEKALPLPAQMFRMGSEMVAEKTKDFSYSLLSLWPVNKQNAPKTDVEKTGLEAVAGKKEPYYADESLGDQTYFTAVYPDVAVTEACVACHNTHQDSPRSDFKLGDTMGGVVIRIPLTR